MKERISFILLLNQQLEECFQKYENIEEKERNKLKQKVEQCLSGILQAKVNGGLFLYKNMLKNNKIQFQLRQLLLNEMKELIEECRNSLNYLKQLNEKIQIGLIQNNKLYDKLEEGYYENVEFISMIKLNDDDDSFDNDDIFN